MKKTFTHEVFAEAFSKLNATQRAAVTTIEGPVMVVAGPGTGKTQILTLRIANILLQTDTRPEQILALTFTESGVRAMRDRLRRFIGAEAYHIPIHTFHSFAGELIGRYPDAYTNIVGGRPASELEKIRIVEDILEDTSFKRLRPHGDPGYYVKAILQAIATLKKEYISPDTFAQSIRKQELALSELPRVHEKGPHIGKVRGEYLEAEKSFEKNSELLAIYRLYTASLHAQKLYDFEDMILDTITALETKEDMRLDVQERYQYILADEHQDVNQSQNRLIEIIASYHERPNVFVVGDEKQAIFRFQGASLDNFLYFSDIYPGAVTIALTTNYRSDQTILDVAHECIKTDDPTLAPLRVPLTAACTYQRQLTQASFTHTALEEAYVISEIQKELSLGTAPKEIAVIVRTNREVEAFTTLLRKVGVPVSPSADTDILTHPILAQVIVLLSYIAYPHEERFLAELLLAPYTGIDRHDAALVLRARSVAEPLYTLVHNEERLRQLGIRAVTPFTKLTQLANEVTALSVTKSLAEVVEHILCTSGLLAFVMQHDPLLGEAVIRRVYDEVEGMCVRKEVRTIAEVVEQFALMRTYGLPLIAPVQSTITEAVQVMTAHKAKGLEFEVVSIPHVTDSAWGGSRGRGEVFDLPIRKHEVVDIKALTEDDERRLLYVAITRAKRRLLCTYASTNIEGRVFVPSRFLAAIEAGFEIVDSTVFEKTYSSTAQLQPSMPTFLGVDLLRETLATRGWSATTFNNYVQSPWEYIYKNVLRFPTVKTPELQFGTAVHTVLERFVRSWQRGVVPTDSDVRAWISASLESMVLSTLEYTRLHERASRAIFPYIKTITNGTVTPMSQPEFLVSAIMSTGLSSFPEVLLTGSFDRLDFGTDGTAVRVVDYKTGKPKTRGEIEGTTKNSDGNYKRQLVFYALLLSLQTDERLRTRRMVLSFVEPDGKGVVHEEEFIITDEEIAALQMQLLVATNELITGACLSVPCDSEKTAFCSLLTPWLSGIG